MNGEGSEDFRKDLVAIMLDLNHPHMSGNELGVKVNAGDYLAYICWW